MSQKKILNKFIGIFQQGLVGLVRKVDILTEKCMKHIRNSSLNGGLVGGYGPPIENSIIFIFFWNLPYNQQSRVCLKMLKAAERAELAAVNRANLIYTSNNHKHQ